LPLFERDVLLKPYSTYGIGGKAKFFVAVETIAEMQEVLQELHARQERFLVLGKGSNLLFDDRGFNGVVIHNRIAHLQWEGNRVTAGAGYSFALLGSKTARQGYRGLEFASGIPASVGGAVYMNAGAEGKETKDALASVVFVDEKGALERYDAAELSFSYRSSPFQQRKGAIVEATFLLEEDKDAAHVQRTMIEKRMKSQPLKEKSCGCVFRNPVGEKAGRLIDQMGWKNKAIGDACISPVHANFIVNRGNAQASDVKSLMSAVQEEVQSRFGYTLEVEVQIIPFEE
jgi:UDP-N-acetylmuramate dehydrogenase